MFRHSDRTPEACNWKLTNGVKRLSVTTPLEEYKFLSDFLDQNLVKTSVKDREYSGLTRTGSRNIPELSTKTDEVNFGDG